MKKLLDGIVEFRKNVLPEYRETFARLALGQSPDALYIGCSDSRVAVNLFASTNPGDLFVTRNIGNLVPPFDKDRQAPSDESSGAVIEFALANLKVADIIVCGHSECGGMLALANDARNLKEKSVQNWLRYGQDAVALLDSKSDFAPGLSRHNRISQLNVLLQLENLKTYPLVQEKLKSGELALHGWWFELSKGDVFAYEEILDRFVLLDDEEAAKIGKRIDDHVK